MLSNEKDLIKRLHFIFHLQVMSPRLLTISQKRQRKARFIQRAETEKIKRSASLRHPLFQIQRETGVLPTSRSLDHEQQGLAYASLLYRAQLHEFEPWPDQYTIKHVVRNPRSGILIASECSAMQIPICRTRLINIAGGHRGGESSVS
jgi:hypothetical protein